MVLLLDLAKSPVADLGMIFRTGDWSIFRVRVEAYTLVVFDERQIIIATKRPTSTSGVLTSVFIALSITTLLQLAVLPRFFATPLHVATPPRITTLLRRPREGESLV